MATFMVLMHGRTIVRVHLLHLMHAVQCRVAADLWTKPLGLGL